MGYSGYSDEQISELKKEIHRTRDEQLAHITSMVRAIILKDTFQILGLILSRIAYSFAAPLKFHHLLCGCYFI